jgi:hypothetical protein
MEMTSPVYTKWNVALTTLINAIMRELENIMRELPEAPPCLENTSSISPTDFESQFNEIECFSMHSERFYDDILNNMHDYKKAFRNLTLWLEAAYNAEKESAKVLDKNLR